MSKVFIPSTNTQFDLTEAEAYGEIYGMMPSQINVFHTDEMVAVFRDIRDKFFRRETDFICLTGKSIQVSLMLAVFAEEGLTGLKVLMFDARTSKYKERILP